MSKHVKYIKPIETQHAQGLVEQVYTQMKRDLGIVPEPFTLHSPAPEILAGVWGAFRESLLTGRVRRGLKEAVSAAVSESNRCLWCVDAHTIVLHATGDSKAVKAIIEHNVDQMRDTEIGAIIQWAASTRTPGAPLLVSPPFSSQDSPEIIGAAITFHYLNRMVNVLLAETNLPTTVWLKKAVKRAFGWLYAGSARKVYQPGAALALLPEASLPADLTWAESMPNVAGAFARLAAVVDQAGASCLSPEVRTRVCHYVREWQGEDLGLSRQWVERAISGLTAVDQAAGRLTLLTALASHQVNASVIEAFRKQHPTDRDLVGALAWASFTTARRIGSWLYTPPL